MSGTNDGRRSLPDVIGPLAGTAVFFVLAPGTVAFYVPWVLTHWRPGPPPLGSDALRSAGAVLALGGLAALVECFARFALRGGGTPAPPLPTRRLIVTGLYRHVRNPMYVGVVAIILGQALILGRRTLLEYGLVVWAAFHLFVLAYEEPTLGARYGDEYAAYRAAVRRWWPRVRPWRP